MAPPPENVTMEPDTTASRSTRTAIGASVPIRVVSMVRRNSSIAHVPIKPYRAKYACSKHQAVQSALGAEMADPCGPFPLTRGIECMAGVGTFIVRRESSKQLRQGLRPAPYQAETGASCGQFRCDDPPYPAGGAGQDDPLAGHIQPRRTMRTVGGSRSTDIERRSRIATHRPRTTDPPVANGRPHTG